jgi:hypothetical protein
MMAPWTDQIYAMLRDGATLDDVEEFVEQQPLNEEQKSALWLLAWAKLPEADRCAAVEPLMA